MKRSFFALSTFAAFLLAAPSALAIDVTSADAPPKKADHTPGEGYDVGVLAHFMTADPVIATFYDKYQSTSGYTFGGFVTRRKPDGLRLTIDVTYTSVAPKDGPWLGAGKDPSATEWTEFRGFSVVSTDFFLGHEFGQNGTFGFYFGGGLGLAARLGTITSFDMNAAGTGKSNPPTGQEDKLKSAPPVIPTVVVKFGPVVNLGGHATLTFDAGLQNGFFAGTSLGMRF